jgi:hypothetical protein
MRATSYSIPGAGAEDPQYLVGTFAPPATQRLSCTCMHVWARDLHCQECRQQVRESRFAIDSPSQVAISPTLEIQGVDYLSTGMHSIRHRRRASHHPSTSSFAPSSGEPATHPSPLPEDFTPPFVFRSSPSCSNAYKPRKTTVSCQQNP